MTNKRFRKLPVELRSHEDPEHPNRRYFRAQISSDELDSHFSRMHPKTLENFAKEAAEGVTILDSHNHRSAGIGKTVGSELDDNKVYADFYIRSGVNLQGQSYATTDDMITMMEDGVVSDVSVGFYGHTERCNMCGNDLWSGNCSHWPGLKYEVEKDGVKSIETATTTIEDGHLSEVSMVYDGASPGAEIIAKAQRMGPRLNTRQKQHITDMYNVDFKNEPEPKVPVKNTTKIRGRKTMSTQLTEEEIAQLQEDNRILAADAEKAREDAQDVYEVRAQNKELKKKLDNAERARTALKELHKSQEEQIEKLEGQVSELTPKAAEFEKAKEEAIGIALKERRKAFPDEKEDHEDYLNDKGILEQKSTIDEIRKLQKLWEKSAKANYPGGKNVPHSDDEDEDKAPEADLPSKDSF